MTVELSGFETKIVSLLKQHGELSASELRKLINENHRFWRKWSGPKFYLVMSKLVDQKVVSVRDVTKIIEEITVKEWLYNLVEENSS